MAFYVASNWLLDTPRVDIARCRLLNHESASSRFVIPSIDRRMGECSYNNAYEQQKIIITACPVRVYEGLLGPLCVEF